MQLWKLKEPYIVFCCFLHTKTDELFDVKREQIETHFKYLEKQGAWQFAEWENKTKKFVLAFYRFRVLIFYYIKDKRFIETDEFIRGIFLPIYNNDLPIVLDKLRTMFAKRVLNIYCYPIAFSQKFKLGYRKSNRADWLDDGITTFYYRLFDSSSGKAGFIRISKWLAISYGLGNNINRELINLTYQYILYSMRKRKNANVLIGDDEFALLEGLSKYTVPTELNLFLQSLAIKVGIYVSLVTIVLSIISDFETPNPILKYMIYGLFFCVAIAGWFLINKIRILRD